jgi:hypothetical protein
MTHEKKSERLNSNYLRESCGERTSRLTKPSLVCQIKCGYQDLHSRENDPILRRPFILLPTTTPPTLLQPRKPALELLRLMDFCTAVIDAADCAASD